MNDGPPLIGILTVALHIPAAQSLKDKRMVLKSLKDRARAKFNVSIAELDGQDKWQVATCAFAMVGNDRRYLDSCLQNLASYVQTFRGCEVSDYGISFF